MRYAIIEDAIVVNIVEWDGNGDLFKNFNIIKVENILCGIGWSYKNKKFIAPPDESVLPD
ncbi:hypothetical protein BTJ39_23560 [Izhakiella australiensis]|uniref:Uncharacterized protein n=1 Tax=Izhakiella australiensis TaxID=1926881 RepID=A0A1S8Y754_9GAMM|nr:hypothetical protein BTJ39_23560 [Izhakiella australiensis]